MKQSGYAKKLQQQKNEDSYTNYVMARQLMIDITLLVLNKEFGFGKDRLKRFCEAFAPLHDEFCKIWNSDSKDMEYTKRTLDEALEQICGEYFIPWEVRYRV